MADSTQESQSESHHGKHDRDRSGSPSGSSSKRLKYEPIADQIAAIRREEPNSGVAADKLFKEAITEFLKTCKYWADMDFIKYRKPLERGDKIMLVEGIIRQIMRVFALRTEVDSYIKSNKDNWPSGVECEISPKALRTKLQSFLTPRIRGLRKKDLGALGIQDPTSMDMGVDSAKQHLFNSEVWRKERHAGKKVKGLTHAECFERLCDFLNRREKDLKAKKDETDDQRVQRLAMRMKQSSVVWAQVVSLFYVIEDINDRKLPEAARKYEYDRMTGAAAIKEHVRAKRRHLENAIKKLYTESSPREKQLIRPWEMERDPEFKRILKMQFEETILDGQTVDLEPFESSSVESLKPCEAREALVWFLDRDEDKRQFDDDKAKTCDALLRDWKRVLALKRRGKFFRENGRGREMRDESDVFHEDILKAAEKKIADLANRFKSALLAEMSSADNNTSLEMSPEQMEKMLKLDRDSSDGMHRDFEQSFKEHFEVEEGGS